MSTDGKNLAVVAGPPPAADSPNWFERQAHAAAVAGHDLLVRLDPLETLAEHEAKTIAGDAWQATAGFVQSYFERNRTELATKVEQATIAWLVAKVPGLAVESGPIATFVLSEAQQLFSVLIGELQSQAAPTTPAPVKTL